MDFASRTVNAEILAVVQACSDGAAAEDKSLSYISSLCFIKMCFSFSLFSVQSLGYTCRFIFGTGTSHLSNLLGQLVLRVQ